jgi:hypothetical protein
MKISNLILASAAVLAFGIGGLYLFDRIRTDAAITAKVPAETTPQDPSPDPALAIPPPIENAQDGAVAMPAQSPQLVAEIERALVSADPQLRETAFNALLPQLLREDPASVVAMVAGLAPGEPRDALREEVTRQWITRDRDAAIEWIGTLWEAEKKASALTAMRTLAAGSPAQAVAVADRFGVGRDDGSLEHLVQIWATENPDAASQWLASQPEGPQTEQLRARIEQVRAAQP